MKEGVLVKQCHNGRANRKFWLFTDLVLYAKIIPGTGLVGSEKFLMSEKIDLRSVQIQDVADDLKADPPIQFAFEINSNKKSFLVYAANFDEKVKWLLEISKASALQIENDPALKTASRKTIEELNSEYVLKPKWQQDQASEICPLCNQKFTILVRRHHCRLCGTLACGTCASEKVVVASWGTEPQRVCKPCFSKTSTKNVSVKNVGPKKSAVSVLSQSFAQLTRGSRAGSMTNVKKE